MEGEILVFQKDKTKKTLPLPQQKEDSPKHSRAQSS